ncbi:MAG: primosomal protein N' [Planctomycetota bacterium]
MIATTPFARIALAIPVPELFDYRIPPELDHRVVPGARVRVPFGTRSRIGYCIERAAESRHAEPKLVTEVLDEEPVLDAHLLALIRWTADYYLAPVGEVVEAAVPSGVRREREPTIRWARLCPNPAKPPTTGRAGHEARTRIIAVLADSNGPLPTRELLARADASDSALRTLVRHGLVECFEAPAPPTDTSPVVPPTSAGRPELSRAQARAVDAVCARIAPAAFESFLLAGVTGSGKTEVYLRCIEHATQHGRGALVLVPEIALTSQTVRRFHERLGDVAVLHSMLPANERAQHYRRLRSGEVKVAIGARSAVFAPLPTLGLIVIDECHETSYKQESSPRYHARDVAVKRASLLGIPCIMGTATPSLESMENVRRGRYTQVCLPERVTARALPSIEVHDRRQEIGRARWNLLSTRLVELMQSTLARDEQVLLFLNRRGFARHTHCPTCGFTLHCKECDIALTYHKREDRALCHYCGAIHTVPETCPDCDSPGLRRRTPGTERIEETLASLFPGVAVGRLDRDTAQNRESLERILEDFRLGHTRILIGTQMVAKGHDIPGVTLVGVVDADIALHLPDFRAAERTAQLICQVAGRAGRGERPGRVVIQTRQPDHYAVIAGQRQDQSLIYQHEESVRRTLGYPPFGHLVRVVCEDAAEPRARETAAQLAKLVRDNAANDVKVLGPAPAPLARLRSHYRHHVLLKSRTRAALRRAVLPLVRHRRPWATTRIVIDVDPQNLL